VIIAETISSLLLKRELDERVTKVLVTLTAKVKIVPDDEQATLLTDALHAYTNACNHVSEFVMNSRSLNPAALNKALYRELRERFDLRSQMAQSVLKTVVARYKTVLTNEGEWIAVWFKRREYDLVWNRDYSIIKDMFSVNTLDGRIKVPFCVGGMEKYFDGTWRFGTAKLVFKKGKWFLHIPVTKEIESLEDFDVTNVTGVDLGINYLATSFDTEGTTVFYPGKEIKHKRAQYKKTRKQLQRRGTPSARRKLKRIGSRENRWMQDVNHCVSKALVNSQPAGTLFVLEDLKGVRSATERVKVKDRYVSVSWAFFDLRQKIEYKAVLAGSKTIAVDPKYTSQTCPVCRYTAKSNRDRKSHTFRCGNCGYTSNDDRIGAMNLHNIGTKYLSVVAEKYTLPQGA